jgi:hypothetical protein
MSLTRSGALRITLAQGAPALRAAAADLWRRPGLSGRYPAYLLAMHGVIRASVPLMELARRRCSERGPDDPVAAALHDYLGRHIIEETGHDDWLLSDLAALGCDARDQAAGPPLPAVARLVGPQYYWIEHHHPVTLLGYIVVLEANAPAVRLADWIVSQARVPERAVRTVREHADLDGGHRDEAYALLDRLPLSRAQTKAVTVSALATMDALIGLFTRISTAPAQEEPAVPAAPLARPDQPNQPDRSARPARSPAMKGAR